jgi:alkylhydroperoxidase family enzyme
MAWIKMIEETEAAGKLKSIYESQRRLASALANILKIHSLAPETLSGHLGLYLAVMHAPGELTRARREIIAVVVFSVNGCHY